MCARPHWRPCLAALLPHSWLLTQTGLRFWLKARIPSGRLAPRKRRRTSDSSLCRPIASTTLGVASASSATCCGPGTPQCQQRPGLGPWRSRSGRGCTLLARIESGEHSRMVAASSSARAARRACGTTSVTKPRRSPSAAVTSRPVRIKPIARWMPGPRTPTPPPKCTHAHVHAQTRTRTRITRRTLATAERGICVLSWSGSRSDGCARARCIGDEGERALWLRGRTDDAGQAGQAAGEGGEAALGLGQGEPRLVRRQHNVARQRQLKAAPKRNTLPRPRRIRPLLCARVFVCLHACMRADAWTVHVCVRMHGQCMCLHAPMLG
jgi:hypothetical protein